MRLSAPERAARPDSPEPAPGETEALRGAERRRLSPELVLFIALGAALRIHQYGWNRSLFIDEAALALNLRDLTYLELLGPLRHAQFAPIGFLMLQKTLVLLFGGSEFVLRLPALAAGLASLVLVALLARRILPERSAWVAVALFALSRHLIFWSADAKPYSIDLLAALILTWLALDWFDRPDRARMLRLGVAGAALCYFSTPVPFVLAGIAIAALLQRRVRSLAPVVMVWTAGAPNILHSRWVVPPEDRAYFRADWVDGFLQPPWQQGALSSYWELLVDRIADPIGLGTPAAYVAMIALAAGLLWLARNRSTIAALLIGPALVVVLASFAGVYPLGQLWPFSGRIVLFLAPAGFLFIGTATAWFRRPGAAVLAAAPLVLIQTLGAAVSIPMSRSDTRRALTYIEANAQAGDVLYLYYGDLAPVAYYGTTFPGRIVRGICAQDDWSRYYVDLERVRGTSRVWLLAAHDFYGERSALLSHLERTAVLRDSAAIPGSGAWLFDISVTWHDSVAAPPAPVYPSFPGTACRGVLRDHDGHSFTAK